MESHLNNLIIENRQFLHSRPLMSVSLWSEASQRPRNHHMENEFTAGVRKGVNRAPDLQALDFFLKNIMHETLNISIQ